MRSSRHQIGRGDQAVEDELRSVYSNEDDETVARGKKFKHYNHETNKQNPVTFFRNEKYKLKAICKAVSCPWQIYVAWKSPTDRSLVVKYYNPIHNCVRVFENTQASSKWLRDKFLPRIQSNPTMPTQSIINAASFEFKVGISRMKAYRAKAEALRIIKGTVAEKYAMLWDYCHELEDKNSGSTTKMHCEFVDPETYQDNKRQANYHNARDDQWSGGPKYQVDVGRGDQYVDLSSIPCAHGIAAIHYKGGKALEDYVNSYYNKDSYMTLYNNLIMPINGSQLWEKTNQTTIKPPAYTRQPGRPRNVRIKGAEERIDKIGKKWLGRQGMQMRCSICGSTGHNKTTHHQNLPQKEKPLLRGKGRPRKIHNQDPAVAADEAKAATRVRRKLAYARAKAVAAANKAALNASQPNVAETVGIGLRASKRQRT
ncbi:hypothetical protein Prudu_007951 [Prunus dulcis]|uniref:Transposase MuDR plant domain-containing protein n=1 Tax=Prunus dulcis TaxID=3755 RepID=A0A4Y1R333_PRUDU|nr:hypothetical protein Prudu_007951 [Prunus dulcis]